MSSPAARRDPNASIVTELKRMAPVWAIVAIAALIALVTIRVSGATYLKQGIVESQQTCLIAQIHFNAGRKAWKSLLLDDAQVVGTQRKLGESALGAHREDERLEKARSEFERALELCPTLAGAHLYLSDIAWWSGNAAETHYHLAMDHGQSGKDDAAVEELSAAVTLDGENARTLTALAEVYTRLGNWQAARETLERLSPEARSSAAALRVEARLALQDNDKDRMLALLEKSVRKEPGNAEALKRILDTYAARGQTAQGARIVMDNLAKAPGPEPSLYHSAAIILSRDGEHAMALEAIDHALAISPNSVPLLFEKSLILTALGRTEKAKAVTQRALDLNFTQYHELVAERNAAL